MIKTKGIWRVEISVKLKDVKPNGPISKVIVTKQRMAKTDTDACDLAMAEFKKETLRHTDSRLILKAHNAIFEDCFVSSVTQVGETVDLMDYYPPGHGT